MPLSPQTCSSACQSYGWIPPGSEESALEDEYQAGKAPRLVYVKKPASEREPELERLLGEIRTAEGATCRTFGAPGELAELLIDDLAALLSQGFYGGRTPSHDLPEGTVSFLFIDIDASRPDARRRLSSSAGRARLIAARH